MKKIVAKREQTLEFGTSIHIHSVHEEQTSIVDRCFGAPDSKYHVHLANTSNKGEIPWPSSDNREINDLIKEIKSLFKDISDAIFPEGCACCKTGVPMLDLDEIVALMEVIRTQRLYYDYFHVVHEFTPLSVPVGIFSFILGGLGLKASYLNIQGVLNTLQGLKKVEPKLKEMGDEINKLKEKMEFEFDNMKLNPQQVDAEQAIAKLEKLETDIKFWESFDQKMTVLKDGYAYSRLDSYSNAAFPGFFNGVAAVNIMFSFILHSPLGLKALSVATAGNSIRNLLDIYYWNARNLAQPNNDDQSVEDLENGLGENNQLIGESDRAIQDRYSKDKWIYITLALAYFGESVSAFIFQQLLWGPMYNGEDPPLSCEDTNATDLNATRNESSEVVCHQDSDQLPLAWLISSAGFLGVCILTVCYVSNNLMRFASCIPRGSILDKDGLPDWDIENVKRKHGEFASRRKVLREFRANLEIPNRDSSKVGAACLGAFKRSWGATSGKAIQDSIFEKYKEKIADNRVDLLTELLKSSGYETGNVIDSPESIWKAIHLLGDKEAILELFISKVMKDLRKTGPTDMDDEKVVADTFKLLREKWFDIFVNQKHHSHSCCGGHGHANEQKQAHGHGHGYIQFTENDPLKQDQIDIARSQGDDLIIKLKKDNDSSDLSEFMEVVDRYYYLDQEFHARMIYEEQELALYQFIRRWAKEKSDRDSSDDDWGNKFIKKVSEERNASEKWAQRKVQNEGFMVDSADFSGRSRNIAGACEYLDESGDPQNWFRSFVGILHSVVLDGSSDDSGPSIRLVEEANV